ncbi:MAG: hypothetical protein RLZZ524_381 [Pseudomonadota bacterium]
MTITPDHDLSSPFDQACRQALTQHAQTRRVFALLHIRGQGPSWPAGDAPAAEVPVAALIEHRIALVLRRGDVVCREGPQDVVCLFTQLRDSAEAHAIARLLMRSMALSPSVQPCIGMALFPRDGQAALPLRDRAAAALEQAARSALGVAVLTGPETGSATAPRTFPNTAPSVWSDQAARLA